MPTSHQNDDILENLIKGNKEALAQENPSETELLENLLEFYHPKPLSASVKQKLWEKAKSEKKTRRLAYPYSRWLRGLIAGMVLIIGLFFALANPRLMEMLVAAFQERPAASEIILENTQTLLTDIPQISSAFGFEYGGYAAVEQEISAGTNMHATNMRWVAIYVSHGVSNLETIQQQIQTAHNQGFKMMLSVFGATDFMSMELEDYSASYASFIAEIAQAGADAIEIWPQANLDRSLPRQFLGAENFALILQESIGAIRLSNPNTIVISGAPAPTGAEAAYPGQVINDDNFLRQLMTLGVLDEVDCLGLSYVEGTVAPLETTGDRRDNYYTRYLPAMLQRYRQIVQARIPICVTSIGYFSTENLQDVPSYFQWGDNTSRQEQNQWLSEAMEWLSLQNDVPLAFIWHIDYQTSETDLESIRIYQGYSLQFQAGD
jgi:hypothetical protein